MAGYRIVRINDDIKRELSELIPTLKDPRVRGLISITRVDTTADLRYCKVYVSSLDKGDETGMIRGLKSASGYLRRGAGPADDAAVYAGADLRPGRLHRPGQPDYRDAGRDQGRGAGGAQLGPPGQN